MNQKNYNTFESLDTVVIDMFQGAVQKVQRMFRKDPEAPYCSVPAPFTVPTTTLLVTEGQPELSPAVCQTDVKGLCSTSLRAG